MSESKPRKPGLWSRLLGIDEASPPAPPVPEDLGPASRSEGLPDFATAADIAPPAAPAVTEASPDLPHGAKPPDALAGASLQPVEGRSPEGGAPGPTRDAGASTEAQAEPASWWNRLRHGLRRTSGSLGDSVTGLFTRSRLDAQTLEDFEDVLVRADLGIAIAARITDALGQGRYEREAGSDAVRAILAAEVEKALAPVARPLVVDRARRPFVILTVGVNGAGKTTTVGKLAHKFKAEGLSVMLAAGDTFRAAAVEQLKVWGERSTIPVVTTTQGADSAGLAFDALRRAQDERADVLMIDTAGRLQNKAGLMAELEKIIRVLRKADPDAPHATLLVLDATVGQNALSQVELFAKTAGVTGLVMTKLDGTARGGILVALAEKFGLPVHFIGVGEGIDDLEPFAARDFARAIAGLEEG